MDPSYNNSFGSPIISPVGGDIVLQSTPKKKSKIWIVLGVLFVVIVAVVGVASFIVLGNPNKNYSYSELFNIYANDVLFGERSPEKKIPEDSVGSDMYIRSHYSESDYLDKIGEEYNAFFAKLSDEQRQVLKTYSPAFTIDFLKKYSTISLINKDELKGVFDKSGFVEAMQYINNYYAGVITFESDDEEAFEEETENSNDGSGSTAEEENGLVDSIKMYDVLYSRSLVSLWHDNGDSSSLMMKTPDDYMKRQLAIYIDDLEEKIRSTYYVLEGGQDVEE